MLTNSAVGEALQNPETQKFRGPEMHRMQQTLLPNSLEDYVSEENPVRVVEVFIDELGSNFSGCRTDRSAEC